MKVSLIITTYNWKKALEMVLKSVIQQNVLPNEVIVADDGSSDGTKEMLVELSKNFPVPLIHSWQEDIGFRAAKSRNKAIANSSYDYIVMIDGDIVLHPSFIEGHIDVAKKGVFVQGGRVMLDRNLSQSLLTNGTLPSFFSIGLKNRKNTISNKYLSKFFSRTWNSDRSTRTCNFAVWREDLIKVNAFNEDFEGWGREDSEMVIRLLNNGLDRIYLKFQAVGYHIYHKESNRGMLEKNDLIYKNTIEKRSQHCVNGLDKYLLKSSQ